MSTSVTLVLLVNAIVWGYSIGAYLVGVFEFKDWGWPWRRS